MKNVFPAFLQEKWDPTTQVSEEPAIVLVPRLFSAHRSLLLNLCACYINLSVSLGGVSIFLRLSHVKSLLTVFASVF